MAKFRGDRPRELGDYALKKKKYHEHFIRPPVTPYGRPNKPNTHRRRQRDETVELRRVVGVYMNSQLAHDDCRRILSTFETDQTDSIAFGYTNFDTY